MREIAFLRNSIQNYDWGSLTAIPELLGEQPTDRPAAELWMGAHPKAPSSLVGRDLNLLEIIRDDPEGVLGPAVAKANSSRLPFLFKVLAAAQPLSIQAHPTRDQAIAGFALENDRGIPVDAPNRNYVDDNHKPEIICALTPFWALSGFRDVTEIAALLRTFGVVEIGAGAQALKAGDLAGFYRGIMELPGAKKEVITDGLIETAETLKGKLPEADWITKAAEFHPGDFGLLSILTLNLIRLEPGQALYQGAGVLHAYLEGLGMELMANSDNVLRGGLTTKHVDVPELLRVLRFESAPAEPLSARLQPGGEETYTTPSGEFQLSRLTLRHGDSFSSTGRKAIEIWITIHGQGTITSGNVSTAFSQGGSFVVAAEAPAYNLSGTATLFRATVPVR